MNNIEYLMEKNKLLEEQIELYKETLKIYDILLDMKNEKIKELENERN